MRSTATTPEQYIQALPSKRQLAVQQLRQTVLDNIPHGFQEVMGYGMIGYVVPHEHYPAGYHCDPTLPLPFANIASQKNHITFYHMGLYADTQLLERFTREYLKRASTKLNMGKSCIRWTKPAHIPYELIGQLMTKVTVQQRIDAYEYAKGHLRKKKK